MKTKTKRNQRRFAISMMAALISSTMVCSLSGLHTADAASVMKYKVTAQPFDIEGKESSIGTINKDGLTYIALRNLNTALSLNTSFDKASQIVKVSGNGRLLYINLTNNAITLNGQPVYGPQVILQNNTTYLPLRFLLERMGYVVSYQNNTKQVGIQKIKENDLQIDAKEIGADGDGKSLLVYYPAVKGFANADVQHKINALLKQDTDKTIAEASKEMDKIVKENNQTLANNPKAEVRQPSFESRFTVTYNESGKLSLYVDYNLYLGGAHGNTTRVPYTFDLSTGDLISLKDAAGNANYVNIINSQIQKQLKQRELYVNVPFNSIEPDREYFLSHTGIVIYFKENEYTSFADGMPEFVIPFTVFK